MVELFEVSTPQLALAGLWSKGDSPNQNWQTMPTTHHTSKQTHKCATASSCFAVIEICDQSTPQLALARVWSKGSNPNQEWQVMSPEIKHAQCFAGLCPLGKGKACDNQPSTVNYRERFVDGGVIFHVFENTSKRNKLVPTAVSYLELLYVDWAMA